MNAMLLSYDRCNKKWAMQVFEFNGVKLADKENYPINRRVGQSGA